VGLRALQNAQNYSKEGLQKRNNLSTRYLLENEQGNRSFFVFPIDDQHTKTELAPSKASLSLQPYPNQENPTNSVANFLPARSFHTQISAEQTAK
jgi:hypothetical protein